jgi:hypothetical protein
MRPDLRHGYPGGNHRDCICSDCIYEWGGAGRQAGCRPVLISARGIMFQTVQNVNFAANRICRSPLALVISE